MRKSLLLLSKGFKTDYQETDEYRKFFNTFKEEFSQVLKDKTIKLNFKKGHFLITGFFILKENKYPYYFSIGDLRYSNKDLTIRKLNAYGNELSGFNESVVLDENFKENLYEKLLINEY
jgi:hypothetical protein